MTTTGGDEKAAVANYFNGVGFERWNKIYGTTNDVNSVRTRPVHAPSQQGNALHKRTSSQCSQQATPGHVQLQSPTAAAASTPVCKGPSTYTAF